jgi:hypothetical protein
LLLVDIVGRREISGEFKASAAPVQFIVRTGQSAHCRTKMVIEGWVRPRQFGHSSLFRFAFSVE